MKGCPLAGHYHVRVENLNKETADGIRSNGIADGFGLPQEFQPGTARDEAGKVAWRQRLEHADRSQLREQLRQWPKVPVVLEGTFGWSWMSDELTGAGLDPHLSSSRKVAAWREASYDQKLWTVTAQ